jgi:hypothetical protein
LKGAKLKENGVLSRVERKKMTDDRGLNLGVFEPVFRETGRAGIL